MLEGEYRMRREEFAQIRFHTHCLWNASCKMQNQGQRLNTHSYQRTWPPSLEEGVGMGEVDEREKVWVLPSLSFMDQIFVFDCDFLTRVCMTSGSPRAQAK